MLNCNRKNYSVDISNQQHKCSNNKKKKNLISTFKRMCKKKISLFIWWFCAALIKFLHNMWVYTFIFELYAKAYDKTCNISWSLQKLNHKMLKIVGQQFFFWFNHTPYKIFVNQIKKKVIPSWYNCSIFKAYVMMSVCFWCDNIFIW